MVLRNVLFFLFNHSFELSIVLLFFLFFLLSFSFLSRLDVDNVLFFFSMVWFYYYYYYFTQRFTHVRKVDERVKPQGFLYFFFFFVYSLIWWTKPMSPCTQLLHFFFFTYCYLHLFSCFFFFFLSCSDFSVCAPALPIEES